MREKSATSEQSGKRRRCRGNDMNNRFSKTKRAKATTESAVDLAD
jgi:hypothetical protein